MNSDAPISFELPVAEGGEPSHFVPLIDPKQQDKAPPQKKPQPQSRRTHAEGSRRQRTEECERRVYGHVRERWTPRYLRGVATREEKELAPILSDLDPAEEPFVEMDGTTTVKYLKRLGPHPGIDARAILTKLNGRDLTLEELLDFEAHLGAPDDEHYRLACKEAVAGLQAGNSTPFFKALDRYGLGLVLHNSALQPTVDMWRAQLLSGDTAVRATAQKNLARLNEWLAGVGRGRLKTQTPEEQQQQNREAKRRYDARVREAKDLIAEEIRENVGKLPRALLSDKDPRAYRQAVERVQDAVIVRYLASEDPTHLNAAKKLKLQLDRERSRPAR